MDGGHVAHLDAEFALQHKSHRGKAVGGARGVGHNVVLGRVVLLVVHAHDDGDVFVLGGGGDDDLFCAVFNMHGRLGGRAEDARAFHHDVNIMRAPGKLLGVALCKAVDVPVAYCGVLTVDLGVKVGTSIDGIVFQQVEIGFRVKQVVDGNHFHFVAVALVQGAENLPPNTAKAVDAYFDSAHMQVPHSVEGKIVVVRCRRNSTAQICKAHALRPTVLAPDESPATFRQCLCCTGC